MREVYWLRKQGVDVNIYSLLNPIHSVVHEQAQELLSITHYSSFFSWNVFKSHCHFLARSPLRYAKSIWNLMCQTFREPGVCLRSLLLFPKSVAFARLIEQSQADHIHAHFVWIDGIAAGVVNDLTDITFTMHPHAFGLFSRNQKSVKRQLEHATEIVTISNYHRDYILELCPDIDPAHVHVVYCALESNRLRPVQREQDDDQPINILAVGRLIEKKGFQYLVAACKQLLDGKINFRCNIVGGGTLKQPLQDEIVRLGLQDHVQLVGSLSQKQVFEFYRQADIFALPCVVAADGDRDGIPVVLMEAMAYEIPVVTTAVTGIPDLVQHEQTGLLVSQRDVDSLTAAIERLVSNGELCRQLGQQGRQAILDKFDIQKNTKTLASIFMQISRTEFPESELDQPEKLMGSTVLQQTTTS